MLLRDPTAGPGLGPYVETGRHPSLVADSVQIKSLPSASSSASSSLRLNVGCTRSLFSVSSDDGYPLSPAWDLVVLLLDIIAHVAPSSKIPGDQRRKFASEVFSPFEAGFKGKLSDSFSSQTKSSEWTKVCDCLPITARQDRCADAFSLLLPDSQGSPPPDRIFRRQEVRPNVLSYKKQHRFDNCLIFPSQRLQTFILYDYTASADPSAGLSHSDDVKELQDGKKNVYLDDSGIHFERTSIDDEPMVSENTWRIANFTKDPELTPRAHRPSVSILRTWSRCASMTLAVTMVRARFLSPK